MVASGSPLPTFLEALCRLVEDNAANCHCSVYLIDEKDEVFQSYAAPSLPSSYSDAIMGLPARPDVGPCGMASRLKTQVIVADVDTDPRWQASTFRPLALAHGLRSCWSKPISSPSGDVLGTFAIYQREAATPTPLQQELIGRVTHLASIAIERAQREKAGAELAHVSRMTTLSALTASIAHEVNPASRGHHHQRRYVPSDAGCRASKHCRRTRDRAAHDSRRHSRLRRDGAVARSVQQEGVHARTARSERSDARGHCAVSERTSETPCDPPCRAR